MHKMIVSYTIRQADLYWMALGSPGVRRSVLVAFAFIAFTLISPPGGSDLLVGDLVIACGSIVVFPLAASLVLMSTMAASRMRGTAVDVEIDEKGVHGWPFWPDVGRSWSDLRSNPRKFGPVITLPFDDYQRRRTGWVFIPQRALTADQMATMLDLAARR